MANEITNEQLDAALSTTPTEALWAERSRRIADRQAEIAVAEAAWHAEIDALIASDVDPLEIIRVRRLGDAAVYFIGDAAAMVEGFEGDHYTEGRTFVETTRRMLEAVADRIDAADIAEMAVSASMAMTEEQMEFTRRTARRSALTTEEKIRAALEGRRARRARKL